MHHCLQRETYRFGYRYRGSWDNLIALMLLVRGRPDILIVVEHVATRLPAARSHHLCDVRWLLHERRNVALGQAKKESSQRDCRDCKFGDWNHLATRLNAVRLDHQADPDSDFVREDTQLSAQTTRSPLTELHLDIRWHGLTLDAISLNDNRSVQRIISTSSLRRLSIRGKWIFGSVFALDLPNLESLRIQRIDSRRDQITLERYRWETCSWYLPSLSDDDTHARFRIDFSRLPCLKYLYIEGICNHIPIENVVTPGLRALKLHSPSGRTSTDAQISQRTPADLLRLAGLAPHIHSLQLDIGHISKLWHPTAIAGVDVNNGIYNFLAALSNFKELRTLRLFPPYVSANVFTAEGRMAQQPISDSDAVAMFLRLRAQIPTLQNFSIAPSDFDFYGTGGDDLFRHLLQAHHNFRPMLWRMHAWGDQTILNTRQSHTRYTQRQVWIGNRKLRSEILRDAYEMADNGTAGGALPDEEPWILDPLTRL